MAALCRDRAAEFAAMPVPLAAALVRSAIEAATRALGGGDPSIGADVLATLRHLLACPSLRDVAIKVSRLKSLATCAIEAAPLSSSRFSADNAAAAVLRALQEPGVEVSTAGLLEDCTTPLTEALRLSFPGTAQVLLDAGADVNGLSKDGFQWPLSAAGWAGSDACMAWLLEHGASLTLTDVRCRTIAHVLPLSAATRSFNCPAAAVGGFYSRWFPRVIAAEPGLLEARDGQGRAPLMSAAAAGSEVCVAALLELGADLAAVNAAGCSALAAACNANSLPSCGSSSRRAQPAQRRCRRGRRKLAQLRMQRWWQLCCPSGAAASALPAAGGSDEVTAPTGWASCVRCWLRACGRRWTLSGARCLLHVRLGW